MLIKVFVFLNPCDTARLYLCTSGSDAAVNKAGLAAVEAVLKDSRRMPQAKKAAIEKMCAEIDELAKELAALQASGKVRGRLEVYTNGGGGSCFKTSFIITYSYLSTCINRGVCILE